MNKRERVYAALDGLPTDQVPLCLWRSFHKQAQTATGLASTTVAFYKRYNFDLIKLTPTALYSIEDWGGAVQPSRDDDTPCTLKRPLITNAEGWRQLTTLRIIEGTYGKVLSAIKLVRNQLNGDQAPVLITVLSPLTIAYQLTGGKLSQHLHDHPIDVHIGLATIAETISRFTDLALASGADGVYFVSQVAQPSLMSADQYQTFGIHYDLIALGRVKSQPVPLILHLDGQEIYFSMVNQYPVHAVSWVHHTRNIDIPRALDSTDKTLMTGIDEERLAYSTPTEVTEYGQALIKQGQQRLILTSPDISSTIPESNLQALAALNSAQ